MENICELEQPSLKQNCSFFGWVFEKNFLSLEFFFCGLPQVRTVSREINFYSIFKINTEINSAECAPNLRLYHLKET